MIVAALLVGAWAGSLEAASASKQCVCVTTLAEAVAMQEPVRDATKAEFSESLRQWMRAKPQCPVVRPVQIKTRRSELWWQHLSSCFHETPAEFIRPDGKHVIGGTVISSPD